MTTTAPAAAADRAQLADKMLGLETISVDDIMIPRGEIAYVDVSDDWDTILDVLRSTPHTRLPVCQGNLDNIVGILHMKKVARALARGDFDREHLLELAREREAYFVPEGTTLDVQLLNFKRDRRRIALVVDEYGDIQGLVTLEDILEEIVGEFTSAPATLHKDIHREPDGSYVVNGAINARVLNRTLGWKLPTDGPRTLNGLIVEYLETLPQAGTTAASRRSDDRDPADRRQQREDRAHPADRGRCFRRALKRRCVARPPAARRRSPRRPSIARRGLFASGTIARSKPCLAASRRRSSP